MNTDTIKRGALVTVQQKIAEGEKSRIVSFTGHVLKLRGQGKNRMMTVRQTIDSINVDRILPVESPIIVDISVKEESKSRARRARKELAKKV